MMLSHIEEQNCATFVVKTNDILLVENRSVTKILSNKKLGMLDQKFKMNLFLCLY